MKSFRLATMFVLLSLGTFSLAERPCNRGVEQHISYGGLYCAETQTSAFALASIELTIIQLQNPGDVIYFKTLFSGPVNGQWCMYVEFVRCVPNIITDISGATEKQTNIINKYAESFEASGFMVEDANIMDNNFIALKIVSEEGVKISLIVDKTGSLVHLTEAIE